MSKTLTRKKRVATNGKKPSTKRKKTVKSPTRKSAKRTRRSSKTNPLDRVMELMAIRGKSGNEGDVAQFIKDQLVAAGAIKSRIKHDTAHKKTPIHGEIGNLVFKLPGTTKKRAPRRLLMAHMDTVPICVGCQPTKKGNFVRSADPETGLGADDRAGCAVVLNTALRILREQPEHPPLTFLWTVQEEIGLFGARYVNQSMLGKPELAFNWDGGDPRKATIGATGGYRMTIEIDGIASHAGNAPEQGVSAIAIASVAIASLQAGGWHGLVTKNGKRGTTNIGVIAGGDATNVVTDHVELKAEARSHDPKFRKKIVDEIERAFKTAAKRIKNAKGKSGKVKIVGRLDYESFALKESEPCVVAAKAAVKAAGLKPIARITNGGVDANWMAVHGIPTVTLGCGQVNPHMVTEALDIGQFETACDIGWRLATSTD